jgi:predicted nuclease of predicted toxin-antitoxin system
MRFLVDAQLPPALAWRLKELGHEAEHVYDIGMHAASDLAIWRKAAEIGAVIVTKDEDFVQIGKSSIGPKVVWLRLGNVSRKALLAKISEFLPQILEAIEGGECVIEIR